MISLICKRYGINNYTINPDGSIDVDGDVDLYNYNLTEFPLTFNRVSGDFYCNNNQLTSLKGCPRWIGGDFECSRNRLSNLEFSPDYVGVDFSCVHNDLIDNYCDTEIGGSFFTTSKQDGLVYNGYMVSNYNEWRKMYKRKLILDKLFD